jgi:predicted ATPase
VGTLLPGAGILVRLGTLGAEEQGLLKGLKRQAEAAKHHPSEIDASQIFSQYTALLQNLSQDYPLIIILDDLHWVDEASNALLFHLSRELHQCRVFLMGTYRPSDVAVGKGDKRHPLEKTLNEIERYRGKVWIDLDVTTQQNGRAFVKALIDSQPNHLSSMFRQTLFERTGGNALFTAQLLEDMQERGYLIQDSTGYWQESPQLNWDMLPAEVEGVVKERIERLTYDLRKLLDTACIEGPDFTAQVVAHIRSMDTRDLVPILSSNLDQRHHLVQSTGEVKIGENILWRYGFNHIVFRDYLYNKLDHSTRKILHADVAKILEALYEGQNEAIAVQLAEHYKLAGNQRKTIKYLTIAGEQSYRLGEFEQARTFFNQALDSLNGQDEDALDVIELEHKAQLLWFIGGTFNQQRSWQQAEDNYSKSLEVAQRSGNQQAIARSLFSLGWSLRAQYRHEEAMETTQRALDIAKRTGDLRQQCGALRLLGAILGRMEMNDKRLLYYKESYQIAQDIHNPYEERDCLNSLGVFYGSVLGDYTRAIKCFNQAMIAAEKHRSFTRQVTLAGNLSAYSRVGYAEKAKEYANLAHELRAKIGNIPGKAVDYENIGIAYLQSGDVKSAITKFKAGLEIAEENDLLASKVNLRNWLVISCLMIDQVSAALQIMTKITPILKNANYRAKIQVHSERLLAAIICLRMEQRARARKILIQELYYANQKLSTQRWCHYYHRAFAQAGLAMLAEPGDRSGAIARVLTLFQEAVDYCGWVGVLDDALRLLGELQKADIDDLLKPIENELVYQRQVAWENRPSLAELES